MSILDAPPGFLPRQVLIVRESMVPEPRTQLATVKAVFASFFATVVSVNAVVRLAKNVKTPRPLRRYQSQSSATVGGDWTCVCTMASLSCSRASRFDVEVACSLFVVCKPLELWSMRSLGG